MGDIADETTLCGIQFHFPCQVLNGDGNALEAFPTGITNSLHHDSQGPCWLPHTAAQIFNVSIAAEQCIEGPV